jgi:hypothetical protein
VAALGNFFGGSSLPPRPPARAVGAAFATAAAQYAGAAYFLWHLHVQVARKGSRPGPTLCTLGSELSSAPRLLVVWSGPCGPGRLWGGQGLLHRV